MKIYTAAYEKTQDVFQTLSHPFVIHLLGLMVTKKDWEIKSLLAGRQETTSMASKYLRKLLEIGVVNRMRYGNEYTWTLNHDKLDEYNNIAARTIGAASPRDH